MGFNSAFVGLITGGEIYWHVVRTVRQRT